MRAHQERAKPLDGRRLSDPMTVQQEREGIKVVYNDVPFRSWLEARWAYYFDISGWEWEYEPHRIGKWLPDFWLPHQNLYVEIKPTHALATNEAITRLLDARRTGTSFILDWSRLMGDPEQSMFIPGRLSSHPFLGRFGPCPSCGEGSYFCRDSKKHDADSMRVLAARRRW